MGKYKLNRSEISSLAHSVKTWNKMVENHNKLHPESKVPTFTYSQIRDNIYSRQDYNRLMGSLKKVKNKNAFEIAHVSSQNPNVKTTNLEYQLAKKLQTKVTNRNEAERIRLKNEREAKARVIKNPEGEIIQVDIPLPR